MAGHRDVVVEEEGVYKIQLSSFSPVKDASYFRRTPRGLENKGSINITGLLLQLLDAQTSFPSSHLRSFSPVFPFFRVTSLSLARLRYSTKGRSNFQRGQYLRLHLSILCLQLFLSFFSTFLLSLTLPFSSFFHSLIIHHLLHSD